MRARHADRLWMVAGIVVIALISVVSYFLLVKPKFDEVTALNEQTATAELQAGELRKRIVQLAADKSKLGTLKTALVARQDALPADSGVPAFLRQLQASGSKVGVNVSGLTVGTPVREEAVGGVWSLPIQLTAVGAPAQLGDFLNQLQGANQKRAVLIESAALSTEGDATGKVETLNLTVKAFVAPPVGAGAPVVTTD
jgi:type IV pilus assembly protein PilO